MANKHAKNRAWVFEYFVQTRPPVTPERVFEALFEETYRLLEENGVQIDEFNRPFYLRPPFNLTSYPIRAAEFREMTLYHGSNVGWPPGTGTFVVHKGVAKPVWVSVVSRYMSLSDCWLYELDFKRYWLDSLANEFGYMLWNSVFDHVRFSTGNAKKADKQAEAAFNEFKTKFK